ARTGDQHRSSPGFARRARRPRTRRRTDQHLCAARRGRPIAARGGRRRAGTVLMNAGLAPGVTNIVAAHLLHLYPEAQELEIAFTLSSTAPRGPASADFVRRGLTAVA